MNVNPILSDSLKILIEDIQNTYNDSISAEILKLNSYVEQVRVCYVAGEYMEQVLSTGLNAIFTGEVSALSYRADNDVIEVSFLPKDKTMEYTLEGKWERKNRQTGRPAKIFQKLLVKKFNQSEWEVFANRFKARACCCNQFELVEGEQIRYWYNIDNYYKVQGSLGGSCMKYGDCSSYFDIYVDNAKMLITTKDGKLTGRALVWEMGDGIVLLDRIYTCFDHLVDCFIDYAKNHKWWIRTENCLLHTGDDQMWYSPEDNYNECKGRNFSLNLSKKYEHYPYIDSFRYWDSESNVLHTTTDNFYNFTMDSTEGYPLGQEEYVCGRCGLTEYGDEGGDTPDNMHWSEYDDCYYCNDCCWYSDGVESYVSISEDCVNVEGLDYPASYVNDRLIDSPDFGPTERNIVQIDGDYYFWSRNLIWKDDHYELQPDTD